MGCDHDCSSCAENCSSRTQPQDLREKLNDLSSVKKVIGVISGKGGVGKSLVTSTLAVTMNRRGHKTAILDADITGPSIPKAFNLHDRAKGNDFGIYPETSKTGIDIMSINLLLENETDPVIWRGSLISGTVRQFWTDVIWKDEEYMFVDMPPGTGDVALTVFQSIPVDGIIIVTSPQDLVTSTAKARLRKSPRSSTQRCSRSSPSTPTSPSAWTEEWSSSTAATLWRTPPTSLKSSDIQRLRLPKGSLSVSLQSKKDNSRQLFVLF